MIISIRGRGSDDGNPFLHGEMEITFTSTSGEYRHGDPLTEVFPKFFVFTVPVFARPANSLVGFCVFLKPDTIKTR